MIATTSTGPIPKEWYSKEVAQQLVALALNDERLSHIPTCELITQIKKFYKNPENTLDHDLTKFYRYEPNDTSAPARFILETYIEGMGFARI